MESAKATGAAFHRSGAEQIEYWADIGRKLSGIITPSVLLDIKAGLAILSVEEVKPKDINADEVLANVGRKREDGSLSAIIANGNLRYQASQSHPGMLEMILPDGSVQVGQFINGDFKRVDDV
tara:strand:+ start:227 stop:595 length:369 start_codon:yes stop_codon:yes gene_type:complete